MPAYHHCLVLLGLYHYYIYTWNLGLPPLPGLHILPPVPAWRSLYHTHCHLPAYLPPHHVPFLPGSTGSHSTTCHATHIPTYYYHHLLLTHVQFTGLGLVHTCLPATSILTHVFFYLYTPPTCRTPLISVLPATTICDSAHHLLPACTLEPAMHAVTLPFYHHTTFATCTAHAATVSGTSLDSPFLEKPGLLTACTISVCSSHWMPISVAFHLPHILRYLLHTWFTTFLHCPLYHLPAFSLLSFATPWVIGFPYTHAAPHHLHACFMGIPTWFFSHTATPH